MKDKKKLVKFYIQLKEIAGELYDMESRHPEVERFKEILDPCVRKLDVIAHKLVKDATILRNYEKKLLAQRKGKKK